MPRHCAHIFIGTLLLSLTANIQGDISAYHGGNQTSALLSCMKSTADLRFQPRITGLTLAMVPLYFLMETQKAMANQSRVLGKWIRGLWVGICSLYIT